MKGRRESAGKSRRHERRVRTAARAALAEVVEPATQLHARANTNAFLTHTSRRCMHCAVHADARNSPSSLPSLPATLLVFTPSRSVLPLHPYHLSLSSPLFFPPTFFGLPASLFLRRFPRSPSLALSTFSLPRRFSLPPLAVSLRAGFLDLPLPSTMLLSPSASRPVAVSVVTRGSLCVTRCFTLRFDVLTPLRVRRAEQAHACTCISSSCTFLDFRRRLRLRRTVVTRAELD